MPPNQPPTRPAAPETRTEKLLWWKETASWSVIAFVAALGVAALAYAWYAGSGTDDYGRSLLKKKAEPAAPALTARRAIDGVHVADGAKEPDYFAVMIDNLIEAHPYSGLSKASLVIEAPVEGGITRMFAVFTSDADAAKIGPVRSARPYYARWAEEYDALYAHVGGSDEALALIKSDGVRDLNEFFNGASFWRATDRSAPHNAYTSTALLSAAAPKHGQSHALAPWKFKDDAAPADRGEAPLTLAIADYGQQSVAWDYDREANAFARQVGGRAEKDSDGTPVVAKDVMVQFAPVQVIDDYGRRRVGTDAGGEALVAMDGHVLGGRWKKDPDGGRTRFYDAAGNEVALDAGPIWIEVVPTDTKVTY